MVEMKKGPPVSKPAAFLLVASLLCLELIRLWKLQKLALWLRIGGDASR
jgi:hypothetical protein